MLDCRSDYRRTFYYLLLDYETMKTFNFSANGHDFGDYIADTQEEAQEAFASDAGYISWFYMITQAEENGGNNVEIKEVTE
jgi:hypothetical protein